MKLIYTFIALVIFTCCFILYGINRKWEEEKKYYSLVAHEANCRAVDVEYYCQIRNVKPRLIYESQVAMRQFVGYLRGNGIQYGSVARKNKNSESYRGNSSIVLPGTL